MLRACDCHSGPDPESRAECSNGTTVESEITSCSGPRVKHGVTAFVARFNEFAETDPALIQATLSESQAELDESTWGKRYQSGLFYLAAHKLACSPFGEPMRLEKAAGDTIYLKEYQRMLKSLGFGLQVL